MERSIQSNSIGYHANKHSTSEVLWNPRIDPRAKLKKFHYATVKFLTNQFHRLQTGVTEESRDVLQVSSNKRAKPLQFYQD